MSWARGERQRFSNELEKAADVGDTAKKSWRQRLRRAFRAALACCLLGAGFGLAIIGYAFMVDGTDRLAPHQVQLPEELLVAGSGMAVKLFDPVAKQPGRNFAATPRADLRVETRRRPVAPVIVREATLKLIRPAEVNLTLAGDAAGRQSWHVDNILFVESFVDGRPFARVIIGAADPIHDITGQAISQIGPSAFSFAAGTISLTALVPADRATVLRFSALDYSFDAAVSGLYLITEADR